MHFTFVHLQLIYVKYYGHFDLIHFNIAIDYLLMLTDFFMYKMYLSFLIEVYVIFLCEKICIKYTHFIFGLFFDIFYACFAFVALSVIHFLCFGFICNLFVFGFISYLFVINLCETIIVIFI